MNALEKKLAELLPSEFQALLEKIETLEGGETDYAIADFINRMPLSKFERFMLVRAYQRFESRQSRFKAMELLFPSPAPKAVEKYAYADSGSGMITSSLGRAVPKSEGNRVMPIPRSRVGHI